MKPGGDFRNQATNDYGTPVHKPMGMGMLEVCSVLDEFIGLLFYTYI